MTGWTRRQFLQAGLLAAGAAALPGCRFLGSPAPPLSPELPETTPWPEANAILAAVRAPTFPDVFFPVVDFGARGDGRFDNTNAFQDAIAACHRAGGGHVVVPPGAWRVGAIRLLSRVDLNLHPESTLVFSDDARRYPLVLTRYEGIECVNRSPMIYALGETDVALTGGGTLDASLTEAWNCGSDREGVLEPMVARGLPPGERVVAGKLRSAFVEPYACSRVLIRGVTLVGARFWQLHPTLCSHVEIDGVTTIADASNTDACDPESCEGVIVRRCSFGAGDDNIALKSGRDSDGRRIDRPCRDVVIMNCQAEGPHAFLACGSEQSGGIENVYAYNLSTWGRGVGSAVRVKSNSRRGGYTRKLRVHDFRGTGFRDAVVSMTMSYFGQRGEFAPLFSDVELSGFVVGCAPRAIDLEGLSNASIQGVRLFDSRFTDIADPSIGIANAEGVVCRDVTVNGQPIRCA